MNLAYVAGLFDGEGCVSFCQVKGSIFPRILVTNTDLDVLEELKSKFGGDIRPLSSRKVGWKQAYSWRLSWSQAVEFLDAIEPWLRIKRLQAHTVFAWDAIRLGRGRKRASEMEEYRKALAVLVERMRWLNQKGPQDTPDPIEVVVGAVGKGRKKRKRK